MTTLDWVHKPLTVTLPPINFSFLIDKSKVFPLYDFSDDELKKNIDQQIYHTYGYAQHDIYIPKDSKILIFDNDEQSIQPMTRFILANPTKMAMWLKIVLWVFAFIVFCFLMFIVFLIVSSAIANRNSKQEKVNNPAPITAVTTNTIPSLTATGITSTPTVLITTPVPDNDTEKKLLKNDTDLYKRDLDIERLTADYNFLAQKNEKCEKDKQSLIDDNIRLDKLAQKPLPNQELINFLWQEVIKRCDKNIAACQTILLDFYKKNVNTK